MRCYHYGELVMFLLSLCGLSRMTNFVLRNAVSEVCVVVTLITDAIGVFGVCNNRVTAV
jgi:hypothetical protein